MTIWRKLTQALSPLSGISDEELMLKVKEEEDHHAFKALFERHHYAVFARLVRMGCNQALAEEVTQDVFLSVFRSRATYREGSSFRPWVTVMARNRLIDLHRAHATSFWGNGESIETMADENLLEEQIIKNEEREILETGLKKLKEFERELVVLWMDDFSYEEISKIVGKSISSVKFALHHAKKSLIEVSNNEDQL